MSTSNLGVVPKLLPVTATFAAPLILINTYLQAKCVQARIQTRTFLGASSATSLKDDPAAKTSVVVDGETGEKTYNDPMLVASSAHKNFGENAPLAMILIALVELNGGNRKILTAAAGIFTLSRLSHAFGVFSGWPAIKFRQFGFFGSTGMMVATSAWAAYLVKGYWGF